MKKLFLFIFLGVLALTGCTKKEKIALDVYVMSQCPYGVQAEQAIYNVMGDFVDYMDFNVEYIASEDPNGGFASLHGATEVEGDLYQVCVRNYYPNKFWDYLDCQNKNYQDLKSTFESCATELGMAYDKIEMCATGDEGKNLLKTSIGKSEEVNAQASPTIYLAGEPYNGARSEMGLKRAFCEKLENKPGLCAELPEDKEFTAYLINDSRCTKPECEASGLVADLSRIFPKMKVTTLDYDTQEGKDFYQKYTLTTLPAFLFDKSVEEAENYENVKRYLAPKGELVQLAIGAQHDPSKEICDNNVDDTGDGKVNCDDSDCSGDLACRKEAKNRIDLFVMSQCPYGTRALDVMKDVLKNFDNKVDFRVSYIADEGVDGSFESLHGQGEVEEDIREVCAAKHYPNNFKYMEYIWCRNQALEGSNADARDDWEKCTADFPAIKTCFENGEGKKLLSQNIKLAQELGIGASPTWMVNNKYQFSGIDAETVRVNFCKYNNIAGCENSLQSSTGETPVSGSCN